MRFSRRGSVQPARELASEQVLLNLTFYGTSSTEPLFYSTSVLLNLSSTEPQFY